MSHDPMQEKGWDCICAFEDKIEKWDLHLLANNGLYRIVSGGWKDHPFGTKRYDHLDFEGEPRDTIDFLKDRWGSWGVQEIREREKIRQRVARQHAKKIKNQAKMASKAVASS